jgi:CRP-like cAMP-binding protein
VVVHQGDPAEEFFLVTSGHGRQFVTTREGRKILVHWLTAGRVIGGAALLSIPSHYLATTELLADSCALAWDRKTMRELMICFPALVENSLSIAVTEHLAWTVAAMVSLSSDDARGRIAHLLVNLACGIGSATSEGIELRITNEDIASAANVTPFTASRVLGEWQRAGVLTKSRGRVLLRAPELLLDLNLEDRSSH